jgi:hypothetical protein
MTAVAVYDAQVSGSSGEGLGASVKVG